MVNSSGTRPPHPAEVNKQGISSRETVGKQVPLTPGKPPLTCDFRTTNHPLPICTRPNRAGVTRR
ncbi:hypothetical protein SBRY_30269 [Actinacidiphila bryophytorum]|uniref:Uncharacterized protein n=1 Tax=Actinacidiphila bryophytorum TaxID=1436133 RepID=A0A9W4H0R3_9ACTN|nr:hypothetical protein SBRY_30269 [Actinacidiphila bryophytorum]